MNTHNKKKLTIFFSIVLACSLFTMLHAWVPFIGRLVYSSLVLVFLAYLIEPKFFVSKYFVLIAIYSAFLLLKQKQGAEYVEDIYIMDFLTLTSCSALTTFLLKTKDNRFINPIVSFSLIVICFLAVTTTVLNVVYPNVVRTVYETVNQGQDDNGYAITFQRFGLTDYLLPHGIPFLIPPLVFRLKSNTRKKLIWWLLLMLILVLVWCSSVMTSIIISITSLVASVLIHHGSLKRSIGRLLVLLVILIPFSFKPVTLSIIRGLEKVAVESVAVKLSGFEYQLVHGTSGGSDMENRNDLYSTSFDTFTSNMLLGNNDITNIGNHSAILDHLATLGLLGSLPWFLFIITFTMYVYKKLPSYTRLYYLICFISLFAMLYLKDMSVYPVWVCYLVLAPCILLLNDKKEVS